MSGYRRVAVQSSGFQKGTIVIVAVHMEQKLSVYSVKRMIEWSNFVFFVMLTDIQLIDRNACFQFC